MSIKGHLRELQWRLMIVAAAFIAGACLAYSYQDQLVNLLLAPLHGEKLVYLTPGGGFSFVFMITIYAGVALAFPVLLQQIYAFLKPVLPAQARRKSVIITLSSFVLLASGIIFGYLVAVPNALSFLYSFADKYVDASLTAESYLSFVTIYTIGIGIAFQVPLLLLLINLIKPLKPGGMFKAERWVILGAFIVAAIITPTVDPVNQIIIAGPLIAVYQLGVIAVLCINGRKKHHAKKTQRLEAVGSVPTPKAASHVLPMPPTTPSVQPALQGPLITEISGGIPAMHRAAAPVKSPIPTPPTAQPVRSLDGIMSVQQQTV